MTDWMREREGGRAQLGFTWRLGKSSDVSAEHTVSLRRYPWFLGYVIGLRRRLGQRQGFGGHWPAGGN